jgi:hypothetical protein
MPLGLTILEQMAEVAPEHGKTPAPGERRSRRFVEISKESPAQLTAIARARVPAKVRSRQINEADIPEVVHLLLRGYGAARSRQFWQDIFDRLSRREVPAGFPRYGYVLESDGELVGVVILIFSTIWKDGVAHIRCNGSGIYVEPAFRVYAPLLVGRACRDKSVTVLNLTAARHTHKMVEATGFTRYVDGLFVALPILSRSPGEPVRIVGANEEPDAPFDIHERDMLLEHAEYGCTSLWCITSQRAYPFVFRPKTVKVLSCQQLVYCENIDLFVRFARPIGKYLARSGQFLVIVDANGAVPGLVGKYLGERPRFFFGPNPPRPGDLAYTEISLFGI